MTGDIFVFYLNTQRTYSLLDNRLNEGWIGLKFKFWYIMSRNWKYRLDHQKTPVAINFIFSITRKYLFEKRYYWRTGSKINMKG